MCLSTQRVRLRRPRLRRKSGGEGAEVTVPAYEAMHSELGLRQKLCFILISGVNTRNYEGVIPEMAESCGVSKSAVSREFTAASAEPLRSLCERRFDEVELLAIYLDGVQFGQHHVIAAIGVDSGGYKHILGLADGATENATVTKGLLESLVARGVKPNRRRLFVVDGSKALRAAIDLVFGSGNPVQRCRKHKIENVTGHLAEELKHQVRSVMKAAYRLEPEEGMAKLKQPSVAEAMERLRQARRLETEYPAAYPEVRTVRWVLKGGFRLITGACGPLAPWSGRQLSAPQAPGGQRRPPGRSQAHVTSHLQCGVQAQGRGRAPQGWQAGL